jgi:hypothetical protein
VRALAQDGDFVIAKMDLGFWPAGIVLVHANLLARWGGRTKRLMRPIEAMRLTSLTSGAMQILGSARRDGAVDFAVNLTFKAAANGEERRGGGV